MRTVTPTTRAEVRRVVAWAIVASATCGGCRSCADGDRDRDRAAERAPDAHSGVAGPTMPTGMLVPAAAAAGSEAGAGAAGVARHMKAGAWVELQNARPGDDRDRREFTHWNEDSWFVSLDAMTSLHEPFARVLPGFDLFLPRLFTPDALARLGDELDAFASRATGDLAAIARELANVARSAAAKRESLWVLAPP